MPSSSSPFPYTTLFRSGGTHDHRFGFGDVEVIVVRIQVRAPAEPGLPRLRRQEIFFFEAVGERKLFRAFPDEENVIGVLENEFGDCGRRLDIFDITEGDREFVWT